MIKLTIEEKRERKNKANEKWNKNNPGRQSQLHKEWKLNNKDYVNQNKKFFYNENKEKYKKYNLKWRNNNLEQYKKSVINWSKKNPEYFNKRNKEKYKNDIQFKLKSNLRVLLRYALKQYTINGKTQSSSKYGINWQEVISYLIKNLPKDYYEWNENNKDNIYSIDHIKPLVSFNLENEEEIRQAFASENHQWLKLKDNISKGAKY